MSIFPFMKKKATIKLPSDVLKYCETVESYLGILDSKLTELVLREYQKNYRVYRLKHHRVNNSLLKLKALYLKSQCECLTPENMDDLLEVIMDNEGKDFVFPPACMFPVLPLENINTIVDLLELIRGYYTNPSFRETEKWNNVKHNAILGMKMDFYARWDIITKFTLEQCNDYWASKFKKCLWFEKDEQARNTIKNIAIRKYPNMAKYEDFFLEEGIYWD